MASSADIHENEMAVISNPAQLRCLDSSGNSGVVSPSTLLKDLNYIYKSDSVAGGQPVTWKALGRFNGNPYLPIRIDLIKARYHIASDMDEIKLVLAWNTTMYVHGTGKNIVGYVMNGNQIDFYIKLSSTEIAIGWIYGSFVQELNDTTEEPSGIVYVP